MFSSGFSYTDGAEYLQFSEDYMLLAYLQMKVLSFRPYKSSSENTKIPQRIYDLQ